MATLEEVAPDIAAHMTEAEAKAIEAPKPPSAGPVAKPPTKEQIRAAVEMLPWVGATWIPATAPEPVRGGIGLSDVARKTGLDMQFVGKLRDQVTAILAEVAKGDDAFKPDAVVAPEK